MNFVDLLALLLPPVSYDSKQPRLRAELIADGNVFAAVMARANQVLGGVTPYYAGGLLPDWERVLALAPSATDTYQQRQNRVLAKLAEIGGLSIPYFINLAASVGYTITIDELEPFRAGRSRAGDPLYVPDIIFVWRVNIQNSKTLSYRFRAGKSLAGERLCAFGDPDIENIFNDLKPAHTLCIFTYQTTEESLRAKSHA